VSLHQSPSQSLQFKSLNYLVGLSPGFLDAFFFYMRWLPGQMAGAKSAQRFSPKTASGCAHTLVTTTTNPAL